MVVQHVIFESECILTPGVVPENATWEFWADVISRAEGAEKIAAFESFDEANSYVKRNMGQISDLYENGEKYVLVSGIYSRPCRIDEGGMPIFADGDAAFLKEETVVCEFADLRMRGKKDYFEDSMEMEGDEAYCFRMEYRPRTTVVDGDAFDRDFVNALLNKRELSESDKLNIANVLASVISMYEETLESSVKFEKLLIDAMGGEWYENMCRAHAGRCVNEFAKRVGEPSLSGTVIIRPEDGA